MKIAVFGVGGIGGYFGGKLAQACAKTTEHQVYFVGRGNHLHKINLQGLTVKAEEGDFIAFPTFATDRPEEIGKVDFVLFCVKNYDFEDSARKMRDMVSDNTFVLPVQNAVNKRKWLEKIMGRGRILDGCVYITAHIESPGVVKQVGSLKRLMFGRNTGEIASLKPLEEFMRGAGIDVQLVNDINLIVWTKYILICSLSAATSYYQETVGQILSGAPEKQFLEGLIKEVELVARRKGVCLPEDIFETTMNTIRLFQYDTKTSMQRDIEQGRKTELEFLSGELVRLGMSMGMDTPLHRIAYESITLRLKA